MPRRGGGAQTEQLVLVVLSVSQSCLLVRCLAGFARPLGMTPLVAASTLTRKRNEPPACTPKANCTATDAFGASAPPGRLTTIIVFNPPPDACTGGCPSKAPLTLTDTLLIMVAVSSAELSARRSACVPPVFGVLSVVMSMMRKRRAVTVCPVLFVNL